MIWWIAGAVVVSAVGYGVAELLVACAIIRKMGLGAVMGKPQMVEEKENGPWP